MSHVSEKRSPSGRVAGAALIAALLAHSFAERCPAQTSSNYAPSIPAEFLDAGTDPAAGPPGAFPHFAAAQGPSGVVPVAWNAPGQRLPSPEDVAAYRAANGMPSMHSTRALQAMSRPMGAGPAAGGSMFEESTAMLQAASVPATWASMQPAPSAGPAFQESTAPLESFDALPPASAYVPPPSRWSLRREARIANREFRWGFAAEFLMLTEGSRPTGPPIVTDDTSGAVEIGPQSFPRNTGLGTRMTLSRYRSTNTEFQIGYFGIYDWDHTVVVQDENNLSLAGDIALATTDFLGADSMTANLSTQIQNFEANVAQSIFSGTRKWIVGFRYINFMDRLSVRAVDSDTGTSDLYVRSTNNLFGGQFGVDQDIASLVGLTTLKLRGGMFGNLTSSNTFLADFDNSFELRNVNPQAGSFSTIGETGISHTLQPLDNMSITIGYNLLWITGLARGTSQVDLTDAFDSSTVVNDGGSIFLHGASAGIDFRW